jgi:chemotaxis methyl-accepting protein methylase
MDDNQFRQLLVYVGLSWQGYRKVRKGVKKRVSRHLQTLGCRSMQEYVEQLQRSAEDRRQCELMMTVAISRFFRDPRFWEVLASCILPELIATCREKLEVWSAGCACGEEVYSLKILWEQMGRSIPELPVLDITATDLNPLYLARAEEALYPSSSLKEVPSSLRAACFQTETAGNRFRLKPALRTGIVWLAHNFFSAPPRAGFHLILIRNNLLTYYPAERIRPALESILKALCAGGYLIIGSHEKLPLPSAALQPCPVFSRAFKKLSG